MEVLEDDSVPRAACFTPLPFEEDLTASFVPAESDVEALVDLFFSSEMVSRGLVGVFPDELGDVTGPGVAALPELCCFATNFRFFVAISFRLFCSSTVP